MSRTTTRIVTFRRPFMLAGMTAAQPSGSYVVETEEDLLDTLSVRSYRRIATTIRLRTRTGSIEYLPIDPRELEDALARDAVF